MEEIKECLVCGNNNLIMYFSMGMMPLVNNLKNSPEEKENIFPLVVNQCPKCTHKQLSVSVDRELLFNNYLYKTNVSSSHRIFFNDFVKGLEGNTVLDIGCNDGALLWAFSQYDWDVRGVEPCRELCEEARRKGFRVENDFFPTRHEMMERFDCITAFNVFAHNDNPKKFLIEMSKLLNKAGKIYILTTPSRLDNFYHEHISYFTPQSMMVLAWICGLKVSSFKEVSMHGTSYLFEIFKQETGIPHNVRFSFPIVAYGASASETVLFNYYEIKPEYVVDDNVLKQGKFMPGVNSPIVSREILEKDPRELTIIVAHHLFDEISAKIKKLRPNKKDRFERLL